MYQALYRKYRSQTFGEMVGQKVISTTLRQAVESGKISHAYLFSGPRLLIVVVLISGLMPS